MAGAETFFLKEPPTNEDGGALETYFPDHIEDAKAKQEGLDQGIYFKGAVRTNPKFPNRAFVTVDGLNVDVVIKGFIHLNRSMHGDTVLLQLFPAHQWPGLANQNSSNAQVTATDLKTGQKTVGINNLRLQGERPQYTNETAVETRIIDHDNLSASRSEDESKNLKENILNRLKPKKFMRGLDEEGEGYNASNSDNNIEFQIRNKTKARKEQQPEKELDGKKAASKLSHSSSSEGEEAKTVKKGTSQLWENLEEKGLRKSNDGTSSESQEEEGLTLEQFLGGKPIVESNAISEKWEIKGSREERLGMINQISFSHRPTGKVVSIEHSPAKA
jgi:hypothetical protein